SATGILAYRVRASRTAPLAWFDRSGKMIGALGEPGDFHGFSVSPDGKYVMFSRLDGDGSSDLWLVDLAREVPSRFTFDPAMESAPLWSPDGSRVVFISNRNGKTALYQKAVRGGSAEELLFQAPGLMS